MRATLTQSDSDSSSEGSSSLPPFQLPKARTDEKWLRDKRILRKTQCAVSTRGHIKPTDSSSLSTIQSNISSLLESTNDEDDLSDLYTPVQKGERHRVPPAFAVPQELSPVLGSSIDEPPSVPSLRLQRDWRPQQTSTSTSFQPFVSTLPKTNPHHGPKFVSSTPRASTANRIPMYSYNQIIEGVSRPSSYYSEDLCELPTSTRSHVENVKPTFYRPENFGLPTGVAKNVGRIVFLSMTLCGSQLNVTINEAVYFQDPYQPQISSYVRVEMRRRCGNSRKRYYREKIQSYKTRNWVATNRPVFNEKFTFYIDEDNYFRDLLTISVYKLKADSHQQRMRMLGCMTFPVKRLMKKAREANDGYYIDENMTMDEVVVSFVFLLLMPPRTQRSSAIGRKKNESVEAPVRFERNDASRYVEGDPVTISFERNPTDSYEDSNSIPMQYGRSTEVEDYGGGSVAPLKFGRNGSDYAGKNSLRIRRERTDDKPGGIFSSLGGSMRRVHRATLPDISVTSETSDGGAPTLHVHRRAFEPDRLTPDANCNIHHKCSTPSSPLVSVAT
ncbi:unnamed protein product [Strongylus vulgaris]|uniref:C2 domain-containing protein n=1 Tax=Strongylus vulgaris TaxID=40348 RepID=A0A3P7KWT8_STRVU|nr:unnamed protein product [Strongylus vulgaris]